MKKFAVAFCNSFDNILHDEIIESETWKDAVRSAMIQQYKEEFNPEENLLIEF